MRPRDSEENQYREVIRILHDGGLVIAPTETFYGILADAVSLEAVTRLLKLKKRGDDKPIPLIAGHIRTVLSSATEIPDILESITKKFWPGPLTLVLKAVKGFPRGITADTGSIGIRIPAQSVALDLAKLYPRPLTATSANFEGLSAPTGVDELDSELAGGVDAPGSAGGSRPRPSADSRSACNPAALSSVHPPGYTEHRCLSHLIRSGQTLRSSLGT